MKEIFMEVYQMYDGEIPYDLTLKEFVAQAEQYKKERELEELRDEQVIKRSKRQEIHPGDEENPNTL